MIHQNPTSSAHSTLSLIASKLPSKLPIKAKFSWSASWRHRFYGLPKSTETLEVGICGWSIVHSTWWTHVTAPLSVVLVFFCVYPLFSAMQIGAKRPSALGSIPTTDAASPVRPPKCSGYELILYSLKSHSLEIKTAQGWVWKAPKGLSVVNANWQEHPTVRETGRGNSPPQHPGWPAYVWMDIFRHQAGFLSLYLCVTAGIDMAKVYFKRLCVPLLCSGWESIFVLLMVCLKHLRHGSLLLCLSAVADDTKKKKNPC